MRYFWIVVSIVVLVPFLWRCPSAQAGIADLRIRAGGISVTPSPLLNRPSKIYATVENVGTDDVEGSAVYYDNGIQIGTKAISIRANGVPEDTWVSWTPSVKGSHRLSIMIVSDSGDATPANNTDELTVMVDADSDYDGIPDSVDTDDDNDGLSDTQEIAQGTNPLRTDTDGDGVDDLRDAFPLDRNRWLKVVAIVPAAVTPAPPKPVVQQAAAKRVTQAVVPKKAPMSQFVVAKEVAIPIETVTTTLMDVPITTTSTDVVVAPSSTIAEIVVSSSGSVDPVVNARPSVVTLPRIAWGFAGLSGVGAGLFYLLYRRTSHSEE